MKRVLKAFAKDYPILQQKKLLIVDDEADYATVSFRKTKEGGADPGVISKMIDQLQHLVPHSDFLQVTATPYSLYLQPEDEVVRGGSALFMPRKPSFTSILPTHPNYVGGDYYFEKSSDSSSPAFYFYREVPLLEREALKEKDGRRLKVEGSWSNPMPPFCVTPS